MATLGLVTVLYNSDGVLEEFFRSLSIQTYTDYHLYLIDNSPSPATDEMVKRFAEKYKIPAHTHFKNDGNYGVAKGNNQGIKLALEAGADFVILLNNDIEFFQPELIEEMVNCAVKQGENLIIPKIMFHGTRVIQTAGGVFANYKGASYSVGYKQQDGERYNKPAYFEYAPTCFMLISRKVFETIGLMDEKYFVYFDDNDFTYRTTKAGFKIYFMPQLEIFHKVSFSTGGSESTFSIYRLNKNRIYFIRKNLSFPQKQVALTHAVVVKAFKYFTSYTKEGRKALLNGYKDGFKMKISE
jgi:GT2 family glycosyltransferase